jgi:hypothetical protein
MGMQAASYKVVSVVVYCQTLRLLPLCILGYPYTQLSKRQHIQTMTKKWLLQCCNICVHIVNIGMAACLYIQCSHMQKCWSFKG